MVEEADLKSVGALLGSSSKGLICWADILNSECVCDGFWVDLLCILILIREIF